MSPPRSLVVGMAYKFKNMAQPQPESEQKCSLRAESGGATGHFGGAKCPYWPMTALASPQNLGRYWTNNGQRTADRPIAPQQILADRPPPF